MSSPGSVQRWMREHLARAEWGNDCIEWPFCKTRAGYGQFTKDKRRTTAHRYVLIHTSGENRTALQAAHTCGNPSCVNPNHLVWKTQAENEKDKLQHGTLLLGEDHGSAKLTNEQALAIFNDPRPQKVLAKEYGLSKGAIQSLKSGDNWGWLTGAKLVRTGLTPLQTEVLTALAQFTDRHPDEWARPADCGGSDASGHAMRLFNLSERGLCERSTYKAVWSQRPTHKYRANEAGREILRRTREVQGG